MTLRDWIIKTDPKRVAKMLRVDPATVSYWRNGHALPKAKMLVRIQNVSKGAVTIEEMITRYARARK